jgi:arsenate reductase-like glutaredoxin family protein
MVQDIKRVCCALESHQGLESDLQELLTAAEIEALLERMRTLLARPILPEVRSRRSVPWSFH